MFVIADFNTVFSYIQRATPILDVEIKPEDFPFVANSPYRAGYDWLYVIEQFAMHSLPSKFRELRFELIGDTGILSEALSNAFCHGHEKRIDMPIAVLAFLGEKGLLMSVIDKGLGFNVQETFNRMAQGKHYYTVAGNGMIRLRNSSNFKIFYDQDGKRCNICYIFKEFIKDEQGENIFLNILKEEQAAKK